MARLFCCGSLRQRGRKDPTASQRARRSASQAPEAQAPKPDGSPKTEAYSLPLNELARNGSHSSNSQHIGHNECPSRPGTNEDYITTTKCLEPQLIESESPQEQPYRFLWDVAVAELSDSGSKHLSILKEKLGDFTLRNSSLGESLTDTLKRKLEAQEKKLQAEDGVSQTRMRKELRNLSNLILSTKDVGMGVARLDPYRVAPIVLGCIYGAAQFVNGATEESLIAMRMVSDIVQSIAYWVTVEQHHIARNGLLSLKPEYDELSEEIVKMYKGIIVLLATILAYFDKKWQTIIGVIVPKHTEWEGLRTIVKLHESNCTKIKDRIAFAKEAQGEDLKILQWLSSHDHRRDYQNIQQVTKTDKEYKNHCEWIFRNRSFQDWRQVGRGSVLWLQGTIGTGKTTIMARINQELQRDPIIDATGTPVTYYFFNKVQNNSASSLNAESCLLSLVRQLSWNAIDSKVHPAAKKKFDELRDNSGGSDSKLSSKEVEDALVSLLSGRDTYLLIDAIDECNPGEYGKLLTSLKMILPRISLDKREHHRVHLLLCSRSDTPVRNYFPTDPTITTSSSSSEADLDVFVDTELNRLSDIKNGHLFFTSKENFPDQLKIILKNHAEGLFRWVEIQIAVFTNDEYFMDEMSIENGLKELEKRTMNWTTGIKNRDILFEEYERLFARFSGSKHLKERVVRLLQLLSCRGSFDTVESLAQAMTCYEGLQNKEVTPTDVRRCLAGFVLEPNPNGRGPIILAHASVREYLQTSATADRFTISAMHLDVTSLFLIHLKSLKNPQLPYAGTEQSETNFHHSLKNQWSTKFTELPHFTAMAVFRFAKNCEPALTASEQSSLRDLVESLREFILSESFVIWLHYYESLPLSTPGIEKIGKILTQYTKLPIPILVVEEGSDHANFWDTTEYWRMDGQSF